MSKEHLGLGGQEKLRDTDPENPRTAAEWAVKCLLEGHVPQSPGPQIGYMCENCADTYARQQVEAALERAVNPQMIAEVMVQAMVEEYGDKEDQIVDEADLRVATKIATAIRALPP